MPPRLPRIAHTAFSRSSLPILGPTTSVRRNSTLAFGTLDSIAC
jgi:hypothetical protein